MGRHHLARKARRQGIPEVVEVIAKPVLPKPVPKEDKEAKRIRDFVTGVGRAVTKKVTKKKKTAKLADPEE